jgi:hypothetical protein
VEKAWHLGDHGLVRSVVPGLLSHDATTGHRFAVTRWRSGVNSKCRYRLYNKLFRMI